MNAGLRGRRAFDGVGDVSAVGAMMAAAGMAGALACATPALATVDMGRGAGTALRGSAADCLAGATPDYAVIAGGCDSAGTDVDMTFVHPGDPGQRASTSSFSMLVDPSSRTVLTAYDASGRLLGVADRADGAGGERLSLSGLGDIARVHISGRGPIAYADLRIAEPADPGHLPEPATWAMLIFGFVLVGAAVRRRIRQSEARFTAEVRRIAESGEG